MGRRFYIVMMSYYIGTMLALWSQRVHLGWLVWVSVALGIPATILWILMGDKIFEGKSSND